MTCSLGLGLWKVRGVKTLLVQGAMEPLHLSILLGLGQRDDLVLDSVGLEGYLKGVVLVHAGEGDIGERHPVIGLDLPDGEGKETKDMVQEEDAGLGGEL